MSARWLSYENELIAVWETGNSSQNGQQLCKSTVCDLQLYIYALKHAMLVSVPMCNKDLSKKVLRLQISLQKLLI